ncbi:MAG: hypothetical protein HY859_19275 [Caulobacterales bacterium]|nr:hypothetical protein [Caulobacterales bacterium]
MAAALDDVALEALAPKGLVRRAGADVAAGKAAILTEADDGADLTVDGESVRLTASGPKDSRCSCPAPGVCRHRLAALIFLRDAQDGASEADQPDESAAQPEAVDWSILAASFTEDRLARFAGKAGWRQTFDERSRAQSAEVLQLAGTLQVRLGDGDEPVIFLASGGLEAALTKAPEKVRKARVTLAALAVRHALGRQDLIIAEAAVAEASTLAAADPQTLAAIRDLLRRLYRAALAFAPLALEDEARRLAVAGRVEALPRLRALLRTIAGGVAAIRRREADADPETLLAQLGEAYALCVALGTLAEPAARDAVTGVVRHRYDPMGDRTLFGVGARLWETPGGALGVTAYFHDPENDRDFRLTQARADRTDVFFSPQAAFQLPIWGVPMAKLAVATVALRDGAASASGRLSTGQATSATASPWIPKPEALRNWRCAADDWQVLEDRLRETFSPGLVRPRIDDTAVVLIQSRFAPLRFDELTQSLIWPIADTHGRWVGLTLPYEGVERARIEALERQANTTPFWAILAVAEPADGRIELRPYALWGGKPVLLDFGGDPGRRRAEPARLQTGPTLLDRLKALRGQAPTGPVAFQAATSATDHVLDNAWTLLLRRAELGQGQSTDAFRTEAAALADRLDAVGLSPLGRQFRTLSLSQSLEDASLAASWAVTTARRGRMRLPWMA